MDKFTAILISMLAVLAAIVTFATKIVEYRSIRAKQKTDETTPSPVKISSPTSQRSFSPARETFIFLIRMYCFIFVFYKMFSSLSDKPATVGDVAVIGMAIAYIIVTDRTFHDA